MFKKSDIIVHAAILFLICFTNECRKDSNSQNESAVESTEQWKIINNGLLESGISLPAEDLPFLSYDDIWLTSISREAEILEIDLP